MFVEGGWTERREEPAPSRRVSEREERVLLWLVMLVALLLLVAPIGGATIVEAVVAALG